MSTSLQSYIQNLSILLMEEQWDIAKDAAKMLSIRDDHIECPEFVQENDDDFESELDDELCRTLPSPFDGLTKLHLRIIVHINAGNFETAYRTQAQLVQSFVKEVLQRRKDENWFLPVCFRLCSDLRLLGRASDLRPDRVQPADQSTFYEQSAAGVMECYRACVSDMRTQIDQSKKVAILNLTNQLFRIYFRINKLNLLKPLIRAIENCGPLYHMFSMSDKVTYKYYIGRKAMFDSDLSTGSRENAKPKKLKKTKADFFPTILAEKALSFAFRNCPVECARNKRLIVMYLTPVKMFLGHMPTVQLLDKYALSQFKDVAKGVKEGNLRLLEQTLNDNEHFFIECGLFLMLEKLKIITYRTLFKKVSTILGTHQVPLEAFLVALRFQKVDDVDVDEVACIIANLIVQGRIKGYISHQHQKLVISKQNPFPSLSSVSSFVS